MLAADAHVWVGVAFVRALFGVYAQICHHCGDPRVSRVTREITFARKLSHTSTQTPCGSGWRIHYLVEVTELGTNKQHSLSVTRVTE